MADLGLHGLRLIFDGFGDKVVVGRERVRAVAAGEVTVHSARCELIRC